MLVLKDLQTGRSQVVRFDLPGISGFPAVSAECHIPTGAATVNSGVRVDFTSQVTAYTTLTGTSSVQGAVSKGNCSTVKLGVASSPSTSYLTGALFSDYTKNNFAGVTGCTPYYSAHVSSFNISDSQESSITSWMKSGALNN